MYPKDEQVQLLHTCRKWSIFDAGYKRHVSDTEYMSPIHVQRYRRHVERSVHTGWTTCRMSTRRQSGQAIIVQTGCFDSDR